MAKRKKRSVEDVPTVMGRTRGAVSRPRKNQQTKRKAGQRSAPKRHISNPKAAQERYEVIQKFLFGERDELGRQIIQGPGGQNIPVLTGTPPDFGKGGPPKVNPKEVLRLAREYLKAGGNKEILKRMGSQTSKEAAEELAKKGAKGQAAKSAARKAKRTDRTREAKFKKDIEQTGKKLREMEDEVREVYSKFEQEIASAPKMSAEEATKKSQEILAEVGRLTSKRDALRMRNLALKAQAYEGGFKWAKPEWRIYWERMRPHGVKRTEAVRQRIDNALAWQNQAKRQAEEFIKSKGLSGSEADVVRRSIVNLGGYEGSRFNSQVAEEALKEYRKRMGR